MKYESYRRYVTESIGRICATFRVNYLHMSQREVAQLTGYCVQSVSNFEHGKNNNAVLLLWYISQGLYEHMRVPYYF